MKSKVYIFVFILILTGCGGKDDPQPPVAAGLLFPENNSECTDGVDLNSTETTINFSWGASNNTNEYRLQVQNLNTWAIQTFSTTSTSQEVMLTKGMPYSWFVTSFSNNFPDEPATSSTWRFYAAGDGVENYAPFPAEIVYPKGGSTVSANNNIVTLKWNGNDIDDDIASYDVYLDTNSEASTLLGNTIAKSINTPTLALETTYYWKVISKDSKGNTSDSGIYEFRLQ